MEAFPFRAIEPSRAYEGIERVPVSLVLDRVRSLYNVGAFFRSGDAAGIAKLYLCGYTGSPPHPGITKTALGAEESLPWEHHPEVLEVIGRLREQGHEIAAVETSVHAVDLYDWQPRFPVCMAFGNEVDGLAPEVAEACDLHVRIPTLGRKQSLNVAVAGGVVMFELLRKYRRLHEDRRR